MSSLGDAKAELRQRIRQVRREQSEKEIVSCHATTRLMSMPEYQSADSVMWYVDVRDEVRTRGALFDELRRRKQMVVPYCVDQDLELFRLRSADELVPGQFGILEPRAELRQRADRRVDPMDLDLVVVPGLAFDRSGGRLGYGKGFYDRCLSKTRSELTRVALAYDCQLVPTVPTDDHDVPMDWIVTPSQIICCHS